MTINRTWLGGGNNEASNPNDWSPAGGPQAGDTLRIKQGTIYIHKNDLAGATLTVVNTLSNPPKSPVVIINAYQNTVLHLSVDDGGITTNGGPPVEIDLHTQRNVYLNVSAFGENLIVMDKLTFIGSNIFFGRNQTFHGPLYGSATVEIIGGNHAPEHMELGGYVGQGLTFQVTTNNAPLTALQIDHPNQFHGAIDITFAPPTGFGYIEFVGLHATSWDIRDDILQIFQGQQVVDSTRLTSPVSLQLQQGDQGVFLSVAGGNQPNVAGHLDLVPAYS